MGHFAVDACTVRQHFWVINICLAVGPFEFLGATGAIFQFGRDVWHDWYQL
jgi:hypothetical protein